ncbi:MAG: haloacid dehalogenase [Candidatus Pelagibacter sp.]|nr:haloacid dehalogenase [Candidatus Pelagibacter sp.]|tara:strand:- start:7034 stop:7633 length:600 start_codon:yes stop_codon:yes gene_type:complete
MVIDKYIFDLGKVIVKFKVENLFKKFFKTDREIKYFLNNICTWDWHIQQDTKYDTSKAADSLIKKYPDYKIPIEAFYGRFLEMIDGIYEENLRIALNLKKKGKKIYILSNFPGDQFDKYMKENRFLNEFDDMIISGKVGLKKPDKKIYELAIKKFDCSPDKTLFIDDRPENTEAAQNLGINIITLDDPSKLKDYIQNFI